MILIFSPFKIIRILTNKHGTFFRVSKIISAWREVKLLFSSEKHNSSGVKIVEINYLDSKSEFLIDKLCDHGLVI